VPILESAGITHVEISKHLDCSLKTVWRWSHGAYLINRTCKNDLRNLIDSMDRRLKFVIDHDGTYNKRYKINMWGYLFENCLACSRLCNRSLLLGHPYCERRETHRHRDKTHINSRDLTVTVSLEAKLTYNQSVV